MTGVDILNKLKFTELSCVQDPLTAVVEQRHAQLLFASHLPVPYRPNRNIEEMVRQLSAQLTTFGRGQSYIHEPSHCASSDTS